MALVSESVIGKIIGCWISITDFQALGGEHIVVHMFLHTIGAFLASGLPISSAIFWIFLPTMRGNIPGGNVTERHHSCIIHQAM